MPIIMKHQLLPNKEIGPSLPENISAVQAVLLWIDLMKSTDKLLLAGFISRVGAESAEESYRRWYNEQAERHGRHMAGLARKLRKCGET